MKFPVYLSYCGTPDRVKMDVNKPYKVEKTLLNMWSIITYFDKVSNMLMIVHTCLMLRYKAGTSSMYIFTDKDSSIASMV